MKQIKILEDEDIGKFVFYILFDGTLQPGKIKGYNNDLKIAWVVYHCNNEWHDYQNYTGASTNYSDLTFQGKLSATPIK